jgi:hypothetical protein
LSSVRELESKNANQRKRLMQAIDHYLVQSGYKTSLVQEPDLNSLGESITESAIQMYGQKIDSIRVFRINNAGCSDTGDILRFQYKINLEKSINKEHLSRLRARTKIIKTGKILGIFGGKIANVVWTGNELADILNRDTEISSILLHCAQIWGEMGIEIEAKASTELLISGPCFTNPETIIALYSRDKKYEEQNCVLSLSAVDRIAQHIPESVQDIAHNDHVLLSGNPKYDDIKV